MSGSFFYLSGDGLSLAKVIGTKFGDPVVTVAISRRSFLPSSAKEQIFKTLKKDFLNLAWILLKNREMRILLFIILIYNHEGQGSSNLENLQLST